MSKYHVGAYFVALGTTADTDVPAVTDDVLSMRSNHFVFAEPTMLAWAAAMSATLNRARLSQASFNVITRPYIRPVEQAAVPGDLPNFANYMREPFALKVNEELAVQATSDIAMGTENFTAIVGLLQNPTPVPSGNIFTLRGTASGTLVANAWTNVGTIVWDNDLPEGNYAVVGLEAQSAGAQAGRLLFPGTESKWRPGCIGITGLGNNAGDFFRMGKSGFEWGRFNAFAMPQVEMLSNSADTSEVVYMDIIKVP